MSSPNNCDVETLNFPTTTAVHFADPNSDGRADYHYVDNVGAVTAFSNLEGPDSEADTGKIFWLPQGTIATGFSANRRTVQVADINGDRRADYLWIHDDGSVDY